MHEFAVPSESFCRAASCRDYGRQDAGAHLHSQIHVTKEANKTMHLTHIRLIVAIEQLRDEAVVHVPGELNTRRGRYRFAAHQDKVGKMPVFVSISWKSRSFPPVVSLGRNDLWQLRDTGTLGVYGFPVVKGLSKEQGLVAWHRVGTNLEELNVERCSW